MAEKRTEITEHDDAGNVTATYVQSATDQPEIRRVDVIWPQNAKPLWSQTLDVFLPSGYPHSVTHDYLEVLQDSLQAFSSSIAGLISSRAVLSSVGVGDATASPTAALLLSILQDSAGRIATILFAYRLGTSLEPECKFYRLLADILNDMAFVLDLLSPAIEPRWLRIVVLSCSSVLRALCGVAAGSAKASLSAHFAKCGNLGELNAKDSSQETVISLLGMLAGSFVVSLVTGPVASWCTLMALLAVHLETNRRAVRAVCMRSMNRQRAGLVFHCLRKGIVPTPGEIAEREHILAYDGVLRDGSDRVVGRCIVGADMATFLSTLQSRNRDRQTGSLQVSKTLGDVLDLYRHEKHILWSSGSDNLDSNRRPNFIIVLKRGATARDVLTAWWQALVLATDEAVNDTLTAAGSLGSKTKDELDRWRHSLKCAKHMLETNDAALVEKGWDLDAASLETRTTIRIAVS